MPASFIVCDGSVAKYDDYQHKIHDFITHITFMTFNCQAASKSAELCCWLLRKGPKSEDMLLILIKDELGKQNNFLEGKLIFFRNVPILIRIEGGKIKLKMSLIKKSRFLIFMFLEVVLLMVKCIIGLHLNR